MYFLYWLIIFIKMVIAVAIALFLSTGIEKIVYKEINFKKEIQQNNIAVGVYAGLLRLAIMLGISLLLQ